MTLSSGETVRLSVANSKSRESPIYCLSRIRWCVCSKTIKQRSYSWIYGKFHHKKFCQLIAFQSIQWVIPVFQKVSRRQKNPVCPMSDVPDATSVLKSVQRRILQYISTLITTSSILPYSKQKIKKFMKKFFFAIARLPIDVDCKQVLKPISNIALSFQLHTKKTH